MRSSALVGMQPQLRQMPPRCSRSTHGGLHAELGGADRGDIAARPAADDDQVECLVGHCGPFLCQDASEARATASRRAGRDKPGGG